MSDSDDFGDFDNDDLILATTQAEKLHGVTQDFPESNRPRKRRKIKSQYDGSDNFRFEMQDEKTCNPRSYDLPSTSKEAERSSGVTVDEVNPLDPQHGTALRVRSQHGVRVPARVDNLNDVLVNQALDSTQSLGLVRGPIWQKNPQLNESGPKASRSTLGVSQNAMDPLQRMPLSENMNKLSFRTFSSANRMGGANTSVAQHIATLPYDPAQELADLPSDAFSSSQSSPQRQAIGARFVNPQEQSVPMISRRLAAPHAGLRQTTLFGRDLADGIPASQTNKQYNWPLAEKVEPPTHHQLDFEALKSWVYPTNLGTIRDYQFNIVSRGLFHNLLVALPTGLGKTFIAATIMLNWFRWTKDAQIVFVAPTKPLVAQQVDACFGIAGIPRSQTTMLTGGISPSIRAEQWAEKRVFFMTPQTLLNDLKAGICDPKRIVLVVVDEAHRATGAYAYVEVVKFIRRFNESFRVLALTATPGSDVESVQKVIDGLDISRIEIRTENSLDIKGYVNQRRIEKFVFENSEEMVMLMELYSKAVRPALNVLNTQNANWVKDPVTLTPYGLTKSRQQWLSSEAGRRAPMSIKGMVNSVFTILASLSHSMELLKYHGIGPFYHGLLKFRKSVEEEKSKSRYKKQINEDDNFQKMMGTLKVWINNPEFVGHPKLEHLRSLVLNHFLDAGEGRGADGAPPSATRIMIFAHWRDSAEEIVRILKRDEPIVRPHVFVGQAASTNSEGMSQSRQQELVAQFKKGIFNTLVATSIGEEGLDIGEIDLAVCYDSKASPIRMLQRMGRTGRKRSGNIILLQMKGKEEDDAEKANDNYLKMQEMIAKGDRFTFHGDRSRRILPKEVQPVVDKRIVDIPSENSQQELPEPKKKGKAPKRPPKRFHMPDGVHTGFVKASRIDDVNNDQDEEDSRPRGPILYSTAPVPVPTIAEVLLNRDQWGELERQYQNAFDMDGGEVINPPNLTTQPEAQRRLRRIKHVSHGRTCKDVVEMLNSIHTMSQVCDFKYEKNLHMSDLEDKPAHILQASSSENSSNEEEGKDDNTTISGLDSDIEDVRDNMLHPSFSCPSSGSRMRAKSKQKRKAYNRPSLFLTSASHFPSSPPPSSPRFALPTQGIDIGSDNTSGSEEAEGEPSSELRDFVAGDDETVWEGSSSGVCRSNRTVRLSQMFYLSQEVDEDENHDEEDMPDLADLVASGATRNERSANLSDKEIRKPKPQQRNVESDEEVHVHRKRRRRVVEEHESDE